MWQHKMFFFFTLKKVVLVLNEDMPNVHVGLVGSSSETKEQPVTIKSDKADKLDAAAEKQKEKDSIDPAAQELQLKRNNSGCIMIIYENAISSIEKNFKSRV
jgi:hypothetical protein